MRHEAECAETIIHRDRHDAFGREAFAVVARLRTIARDEAAAEEINEHGKPVSRGLGGCTDIQVEAVFAHTVRAETHVAENRLLHAARTELLRVTHAGPWLHRLRLFPAQAADRRRRER